MLMSLASQQEVITHPTYSRNCNDKPTIVSHLAGHWASGGGGGELKVRVSVGGYYLDVGNTMD